jgi:hypothetical protein
LIGSIFDWPDRKGTSDCAEVTLSRKGAKSQTPITGLRSTRTKASDVHPIREPVAGFAPRFERLADDQNMIEALTPKRSDQALRLVRDRKPPRLDFPANSRPAPVQP